MSIQPGSYQGRIRLSRCVAHTPPSPHRGEDKGEGHDQGRDGALPPSELDGMVAIMVIAILVRWVLNAAALWIVAHLISGVTYRSIPTLLWTAAVLGLVNALIRPILLLVTLPLNILTLGLFTFVINAIMLLLVDALIPGFDVAGFWTALLAAVLLAIVGGLLSWLVRG
ncbi:MAG TPA: phage holin family protein [Methylomirabilota bacterium]|nr:phage holin family protein [Methylomirabilota bacterium]